MHSGTSSGAATGSDRPLDRLAALVCGGDVVVLSGAGLSTESGIPDYRGDGSRPRRAPMTYQAFLTDPGARRRYWARGHLGWRHLAAAAPNTGHRAVATLERLGVVRHTITQNVDGLHQRAGAVAVTDLHGRLDRVVCLRCGELTTRSAVAAMLEEANPGWGSSATQQNPDGDAELPDAAVEDFQVVGCAICGGLLKPDVVFVGESVPPSNVHAATAQVEQAGLLLVLGTSLTVWSGRRFVAQAVRQQVPVAVVNDGPTRADEVAAVRVSGRLGVVLASLLDRLPGPGAPAVRAS